jgi:hypothetical protein
MYEDLNVLVEIDISSIKIIQSTRIFQACATKIIQSTANSADIYALYVCTLFSNFVLLNAGEKAVNIILAHDKNDRN